MQRTTKADAQLPAAVTLLRPSVACRVDSDCEWHRLALGWFGAGDFMEFKMSEAQTFFSLLYALYFAAVIPLTGRFHPFDTPSMSKCEGRAWFRFLVAFVFLNIFPLAYFVFLFLRFANLHNFGPGFCSMLWDMFRLLLASLGGFGFYRIFVGLTLIKCGDIYLLYGTEGLPTPVQSEFEQRGHLKSWRHVVPGIIWVLVAGATGWSLLWT